MCKGVVQMQFSPHLLGVNPCPCWHVQWLDDATSVPRDANRRMYICATLMSQLNLLLTCTDARLRKTCKKTVKNCPKTRIFYATDNSTLFTAFRFVIPNVFFSSLSAFLLRVFFTALLGSKKRNQENTNS